MRKVKNGSYYINGHSCFLLSFHLVLVTKYRKPVLSGDVKDTVYGVVKDVLHERGCVLQAINGEADHVHVFFDAPPDVNLLDTVRVIKTKSARFSRSRYPAKVAQYYWKPYFWSDSYFIASVSDNTRDTVEQYIRNQ